LIHISKHEELDVVRTRNLNVLIRRETKRYKISTIEIGNKHVGYFLILSTVPVHSNFGPFITKPSKYSYSHIEAYFSKKTTSIAGLG
jgi:hypothetical protein